MKTKLCTLLSLSLLSACGGGGGSGAQSVPPEARSHSDIPQAINVDISPRTTTVFPGETLEGSYEFFSSSIPTSLDGSSFHWETSNHTTISYNKTYTVGDDDTLVDDSIKFCVTPINRGDRKQGEQQCSEPVLIIEKPKPEPIQIVISDDKSELRLFAYDKYQNLPIDGIKYIWRTVKADYSAPVGQYYPYSRKEEGNSVEACVEKKDSGALVACSQPYTIQPIDGLAPTADVEDFGRIVKSGQTVALKYTFNDEDGDEEDTSKSLFTWYVGDQKQSNHGQTFTPDKNMALNTLKGCITPYSKTGSPKAGEETCNQRTLIYSSDPSAPEATELHISGAKFEGHKVTGSYQYFDKNHDPESNSMYEWRIHRETDTNDYEIVSHDLSYTLQKGDEGRGNTIEFCVTPHDATSPGSQTCIKEDIAWFEGKGRFDETGKVVPVLKGYPSFKSSNWESMDGGMWAFNSVNPNSPAPFDGTSVLASLFRGQPVLFCIDLNGEPNSKQNHICREMKTYSNNKLLTFDNQSFKGKLARVFDANDPTRIAFPYKVKLKVTKGGKTKTFFWPITWEQLMTLDDRDWQLFAEKYHHGVVDYVKMKPIDAQKFCSNYYRNGTFPMMRETGDWVPNRPTFFDYEAPDVLRWGPNRKIYANGVYFQGEMVGGKRAHIDTKYLFSCVSRSEDTN